MPAEWEAQEFIQLTFPHEDTDWSYMLDEVTACFVEIAKEVTKRQRLLVVCTDKIVVQEKLKELPQEKIIYVQIPSNDTWARDHGGIAVIKDGKPEIQDFTFNGWGLKFAANKDNRITCRLVENNIFPKKFGYKNRKKMVLEGGSVESDGNGTIMTTKECLLSENRNNMSQDKIEKKLKKYLGAERVLWLENGFLIGDDTDSHIDTLARFCSDDTIAYVKCTDENEKHFEALQLMEKELKEFRILGSANRYNLIPLPMADAVMDENGGQLPATYANFLIINNAVLVPTYNSPKDEEAMKQLKKAFPDREMVGVDCSALIKQHGSLHCVTMQYPKFV
ncbi:MAG: agmatine deiminase family protein [Paludibacteraceae bacterium]